MHCAWYVFNDSNTNRNYDVGEEVSPYFYMGANTKDVRDAGIYSEPKVEASPLRELRMEIL